MERHLSYVNHSNPALQNIRKGNLRFGLLSLFQGFRIPLFRGVITKRIGFLRVYGLRFIILLEIIMKKKETAESLYHGAAGYNCTQAVLAAFQQESGMTPDDIQSFSHTGGGRAEGGVCGAIHAAKQLLKNPAAVAELEKEFLEKAGSIYCREIRKINRLACRSCVGLAAGITEKQL